MNIFRNFTMRDNLIFSGNALMLATCLLYIAWWTSAFRTGPYRPSRLSSILLICIFVVGVTSVFLLIRGILIPVVAFTRISSGRILIGAAALYIALLIISRAILNRPVTSELLIMIVWAAGELCALSVLYSAGRFGKPSAIVLISLIAAATIAGFICYLKYYHLSGTASFIDGIIPLASDAAVIAVFLILHAAAAR